jgi:hypothetical protein
MSKIMWRNRIYRRIWRCSWKFVDVVWWKVPCVNNKSFISSRTRNILYLASTFRNKDNLPTTFLRVQWSCFLRTTAAVSGIPCALPHPHSHHQLVLNTPRKTPPVLPDPTISKARRLAFLGTNNCVPRSACPLTLCCISICAGTRYAVYSASSTTPHARMTLSPIDSRLRR